MYKVPEGAELTSLEQILTENNADHDEFKREVQKVLTYFSGRSLQVMSAFINSLILSICIKSCVDSKENLPDIDKFITAIIFNANLDRDIVKNMFLTPVSETIN